MELLVALPQILELWVLVQNSARCQVHVDQIDAAARADQSSEMVHNLLFLAAIVCQHMPQHRDVDTS
ncbi:MAG: hypothetical protein ACRD1G_13150 [Acidimicrobiales bacterium]